MHLGPHTQIGRKAAVVLKKYPQTSTHLTEIGGLTGDIIDLIALVAYHFAKINNAPTITGVDFDQRQNASGQSILRVYYGPEPQTQCLVVLHCILKSGQIKAVVYSPLDGRYWELSDLQMSIEELKGAGLQAGMTSVSFEPAGVSFVIRGSEFFDVIAQTV